MPSSLLPARPEDLLRRWLNPAGSIPGIHHANSAEDAFHEEYGDWRYLVVDPRGIRPRAEATYDRTMKSANSNCRYKVGTVVEVSRRRRGGWTQWLGLKSKDQWLFDVSPKDKKIRLVEVEVASGEWPYFVSSSKRLAVLPHPSLTMAMRSPKAGQEALEPRQVVRVNERVRPLSAKGSFLKLEESRGWVLDFADGQRLLERLPVLASNCEFSEEASLDSLRVMMTSADPFDMASTHLANGYCSQACGQEPESDEAKVGDWHYIVMDPNGITLRASPTYNPSRKISHKLKEGQVVRVTERRSAEQMMFLRIEEPQGWAFDRQPGSASSIRMMQVDLECGLWHYTVVAEKGVALRFRCSVSDAAKCRDGPQKGALVAVTQRLRVGETTFLKLRDEELWIFDCKCGRKLVDGPVDLEHLPIDSSAVIRATSGIFLLSSPTNQKWALSKLLLLDESRVNVTKRCEVEGRRWLFVEKPGSNCNVQGWVPSDCVYESGCETPRKSPTG